MLNLKLDTEATVRYCQLTPGLHRINARGESVVDQTALAEKLGVSQSTVSRLLMGRTQPELQTVGRLLGAFPKGVVKFEHLFITDDDQIAA